MKLSILASSSAGNCSLIDSGNTRVLVDAGLSAKQIYDGLAGVGVDPATIAALTCSHAHGDHANGLGVIAKDLRLPIYMTNGTATELIAKPNFTLRNMVLFRPGASFTVRDIAVRTFAVPHDALEPVGFLFSDGRSNIAITTDLGHIPDGVAAILRGADILLIEANHDVDMLAQAKLPGLVKKRILSDYGHLSNDQVAEFLRTLTPRTKQVILGHLSSGNNTPELAELSARHALNGHGVKLSVAGKGILHAEC